MRQDPPTQIGNRSVTAFHDRQSETGIFGSISSETERASRDVLVFELGEHARVILRPSGTEPKNKVYVELAEAPSPDQAPPSSARILEVENARRQLGEDFVLEMLSRVNLTLPRWALKASEILSVEQKLDLADRIVPDLKQRLTIPDSDLTETRTWLHAQLSNMGPDGPKLVQPALLAWAQETQPALVTAIQRLL